MSALPAPGVGLRLTSRTVPLDGAPDLLARLPTPNGIVWVREAEGFVAWGEAARIDPGRGPDRFARAAEAVASILGGADVADEVGLPGTGPIAFGSFTFDPDSPRSWLVVPAVVVGCRQGRAWITLTGQGALPSMEDVPAGPAASPAEGDPGPSIPEQAWMEAMVAAREAILGGALDKVVLARQVVVEADEPFDPRVVARRLAASYPECITFVAGGMAGATPELLVRRTGRSVYSVALAGSAPRDDDPGRDTLLGEALLRSPKDRREHQLAVQTVSDALAPLCRTLTVEPEPSLMGLANVQHLRTRIEGELAAPLSALELAGALHPTAAVCGAPTGKALELIRDLEGFDRGHYAGPVGWVDAGGDGEWAIALRCAELSGRRARLFAGAGIMAESDPEAELEETRLKLQPILAALELA